MKLMSKPFPAPTATEATARRVIHRTRGHGGGPVTRLMSPSDLGELLRPFVFLDHFDTKGASQPQSEDYGLHPHSGIATLTWMLEGSVNYEDTMGRRGKISEGHMEWMQAGGGAWHGGNLADSRRIRGFQLWVALPPELELGQGESIYLAPQAIKSEGPVTVLLGQYGAAASSIKSPSSINYFSVKLKAGQRWHYQPPQGHTVAWAAVSIGQLSVPDKVQTGELAVFEDSSEAIDFRADADTEFVVGSAVKHQHDLVLGYYSVHTSPSALSAGEARIREIGSRLHASGRLR